METRVNFRFMVAVASLALLAGCTSLSEKSNSLFADKQPGIDNLDTITKDDKEEKAWFGSFYGSNHCGVWEGTCPPGQGGE